MSSDSTSLFEYEPVEGSRKENNYSVFKVIGCVLGVMAIVALVGMGGMDTIHTTTTNLASLSVGSVQSAKVQEAVGPVGIGNELSSSTCQLPVNPGPCLAYLPHYYFNAKAGKCQEFIYGGCGGNGNKFETLEKCRTSCSSSVQSAKVQETVGQQNDETVGIGNELSSSVCELPPKTGPCKAYFSRYYFNTKAEECRKFVYGGCGGNGNNFTTRENCQASCSSSSGIQGLENRSCGPTCKKYCPFGFKRDSDGCEICKCACPPHECPNSMQCPHGFDEVNGCKICQCKEALSSGSNVATPQNDEAVQVGNEFSASATNLAKGRPTWQSSTGWGGSSSRAVDGNTNGNWGGGSCTHTNKQTNPNWNVDLGKIYKLSKIRLYNRVDCCSERLRNINILVSTDKKSWVPIGKNTSDNRGKKYVDMSFSESKSPGRYVRVQLDGSQYLTLCEVEISGRGGKCDGPHKNKYSSGYAGGTAKKYSGFSQAEAECLKMSQCNSITQEPNKLYTLRASKELYNSPSGETSWKCGFSAPSTQLPDRYKTGPSVVKETILVPSLYWTQNFGGWGGTPFSTLSCFPWGIKRIRIWGGRWVDKVQFQCRNGDWKYPTGGRLQGAVNEFEVPSTEYINGVRVYAGSKIDAIDVRITGFVTSSERYLGKIGGSGGNLRTVYGSGDKKELYAFAGRAGDVLDQLRFGFSVTKAFCAVAEEIAGKKCEKLRQDASAKTSGDCNAACCKDVSCGVWQFDSSNRCWREDSSHQTGMCTKQDASVVAGYRLVGDSVKGAVFEGQPKVPPAPLPHGSPPATAWPSCWIDAYGRGVGEPLSTCPRGDEKNGLLCYPQCKSGYYGVGPVCWEKCPHGWNDGGVFCNVWMHTVTAQVDCPWYDCCGLTFARGCTKCPSGYANHGCLCTKPPKHMTKSAYGRTAGKPMICPSHLEQQIALCYERCASGYKGVGPVCWGQCPSSHPHKCGPLMCTKNAAECSGKISNLAKNIFLKGGIPGLVGIADELCIPKCGDQRHMACTILGKVNDAISVCPLDITQCPKAFKCLSFLGKRAEEFAKGVSKLLSGGALKDFNSFFTGSGGIQGCIKAAGGWFKNDGSGCDVKKDGTFKEFAKCSVPIFKGMFLDDFSSPSLYVSIGASGVLGIVGGGTTFDVNFGFDGSILFSYTKCNTLSTPDLGGGISVSIGMFGSKNDIPGESYVLAAGAGIPGTDIDANAEIVYSSDGERVIAMGANFGIGLGLELAPISASCSNCDTKVLGCVTTLEEIGLGYLM